MSKKIRFYFEFLSDSGLISDQTGFLKLRTLRGAKRKLFIQAPSEAVSIRIYRCTDADVLKPILDLIEEVKLHPTSLANGEYRPEVLGQQ